MKLRRTLIVAALVLGGLVSLPTLARQAANSSATHNYQVTGPVLEVSDTSIVVQKGKEKWEIQRTSDTSVKGDVKVGDKVTIHYHMVADSIDLKSAAKKPQ